MNAVQGDRLDTVQRVRNKCLGEILKQVLPLLVEWPAIARPALGQTAGGAHSWMALTSIGWNRC